MAPRIVQLINLPLEAGKNTPVHRREKDDLPDGVVGTARWQQHGQGGKRHCNNGYYITVRGQEFPVEFINHQWYWITWADFNWYTAPDEAIPVDNEFGLGWWSSEDKQYVSGLAGATSGYVTLGEEDQSAEPSSRAQVSVGPSSYTTQDISAGPSSSTAAPAESAEPSSQVQGRFARYGLGPLKLPELATEQAQQTTPQVPAMDSAAQIAAGNVAPVQHSNGDGNKSTLPEIFKGDRAKSQVFLRELRIYMNLNQESANVKNAFQRVNLALSRIRGEKVNEWVDEQLQNLVNKTTGANALQTSDEALWNAFYTDFKRAFTNTTEELDAHQALKRLRMQGEDLDTYVATFRTLARKAHYELDAVGTLDIFAEGLPHKLWEKILGRDNTPKTFNEWVSAAQKEQQKYLVLKTRSTGGKATLNARREGWRRLLWGNQPRQQQRRLDGVVPMDVDTVETTAINTVQTRDTRTCYKCGKIGHISKNCRSGQTCHKCGKNGHTQEYCRSKGNNQSQSQGNGPRPINARIAELRLLPDKEKEELMEAALAEETEENKDF